MIYWPFYIHYFNKYVPNKLDGVVFFKHCEVVKLGKLCCNHCKIQCNSNAL